MGYYGGLGYGYGLHGLGYAGYGYGLHGLGYAGYGYHGVPFGSSTGLDPITQGLDASTQGHLGYGHHYGHYIGKREADADAYYGHLGYGYGLHGLGYAGYGHHGVYAAHAPFGSSTGLDPITQGLDASTQGHL